MTLPRTTPKRAKSLGAISKAVAGEVTQLPPEDDDSQTFVELDRASAELSRFRLQNAELEESIANLKADRGLRKKYADNAFRFLVCFSAFSALVLIAQGSPWIPFKLGENIVIALIGSTAVSVVGLVGWVARGLFKAPGSS